MVHSFVHWHNKEEQLADSAWSASSGAMMFAADITSALGARRLAPVPGNAVDATNLPPYHLASVSVEARRHDRILSTAIVEASTEAELAVTDTEFKRVCSEITQHFEQIQHWTASTPPPKIDNPCQDFKRVVEKYIWQATV